MRNLTIDMRTLTHPSYLPVLWILGMNLAWATGPEKASLPRTVLTNEGIVVLARAGYGERFIADLIKQRPVRFDTTVDGLAFLAEQGISENLVRKMVEAERTDSATVEENKPAWPALVPMRPVKGRVLAPSAEPAGKAKDVWYFVSAPVQNGKPERRDDGSAQGYFAYRLQ
jgi:hypothetical protein